jgi:hypothetical protein
MKSSPPIPISDDEREQALKYKSHKIHPPFDRLPPEIQKLQLWAQMLPPRVAQSEKDDYTPEEFQLLYEIQQFGRPLGNKPLITMIGMQEAEDKRGPMSVEQWHTLHQEKIEHKRALRTLSTNSKVIEVQDAGHSIHLEDPDAVVGAIHDVMNAASHGRLLLIGMGPQYVPFGDDKQKGKGKDEMWVSALRSGRLDCPLLRPR